MLQYLLGDILLVAESPLEVGVVAEATCIWIFVVMVVDKGEDIAEAVSIK
jgi:hypothetical protein